MDGGRVLRALLARRRTYARATQIAAEVGKFFAIMLGLFGLFVSLNLFLIAIAFFIYIGASSEAQMTAMKAAFEGVQVQDVMTPADRIDAVDAELSVTELVERMFRERHTGYPVERNGEIVGMVTLEDARAVREVERDAYRVEEVMSTDLETIEPTAEAMDAMMRIEQNDIGRLLVHDGEEMVGILTRSDLVTALNIIQSSESFQGGADAPGDPIQRSETRQP
jgi:CBS domain-containing protein